MEQLLKNFKFEFGNENHIEIMKLLKRLATEKKKLKTKRTVEEELKKMSAVEQNIFNLEERIKGLMRK